MDAHRFSHEIDEILNLRTFAVVGVSRNPQKFGHQVYKTLKQFGYNVYAINPNVDEIDGDPVYPRLDNVPEPIECVVTVVPPGVTESVLREAWHLKIPYCWMQPGSESEAVVNEARSYGMQVVHGGPCIMVESAARA